MADLQHKLVLLSDGLLASMAANEQFRKEFPFITSLQAASARRSGCGSCGGANRQRAGVFQAAKKAFAGLDSARKQTLKRLLNAQQARIIYTRDDGRTIQLTF